MIKPNELVNGRYVHKGIINFTFIKDGILGAYIRQNRFDSSLGIFYPLSEIEGIPITEEWLLKFGFEKIGNTIFKKESFEFNLYVDSTGTLVTYGDSSIIYIYDIHQLQNLYFALTGEELTIKE